jgi:hypothetical protein
MDDSTSGGFSLNELVLTIDLFGQSGVKLSFYHKEFGDENHTMPGSFTGSHNSDGVAISADGSTWYKAQGLTSIDGISSGYKKFEVDLDLVVASAGITYNSAFKIKFQQYDNYPIPSDGFAFDDIILTSTTGTGNGRIYGLGGNGRIYRWDSFGWTQITNAGGRDHFHFVSETEIYVLGGNGQIYRWNGSSFEGPLTDSVLANDFYYDAP